MKVIDPGHLYSLSYYDRDNSPLVGTRLTFMKREGLGYPGNIGHHPGTNIQEVLRALIDRVKYLDNQIPDENNHDILMSLRFSLYLLEERARRRRGDTLGISEVLPGEIENIPTCSICGHILCKEHKQ